MGFMLVARLHRSLKLTRNPCFAPGSARVSSCRSHSLALMPSAGVRLCLRDCTTRLFTFRTSTNVTVHVCRHTQIACSRAHQLRRLTQQKQRRQPCRPTQQRRQRRRQRMTPQLASSSGDRRLRLHLRPANGNDVLALCTSVYHTVHTCPCSAYSNMTCGGHGNRHC